MRFPIFNPPGRKRVAINIGPTLMAPLTASQASKTNRSFWIDTRDKWLQTKNKDAHTYLNEAEANWPDVKVKEP